MNIHNKLLKNKKHTPAALAVGVTTIFFVLLFLFTSGTSNNTLGDRNPIQQLAASQSSLSETDDVYVDTNIDSDEGLELVSATGDFTITRKVEYTRGKVDGGDIPLLMDIYNPAAECGKKKRPVVLMIHGGGFEKGARDTRPYRELGKYLAAREYFVASMDYRLMRDNPIPSKKFQRKISKLIPVATQEQVDVTASVFEDTIAAIDYLKDNASEYCVNPKRMALLGDSAGAMTSMAAAYSFDDLRMGRQGVDVVIDLWGINIDPAHMESHEAEILIIHGTGDLRAPYEEALAIEARANEIGLPIEFYTIEADGHGFDAIDIFTVEVAGITLVDRIVNFLETYL